MRYLFLVLALTLPSQAAAHGVGQAYTLPVPLEYYLIGSATAVAVSFFALAHFVHKRPQHTSKIRRLDLPWLPLIIKIAQILSLLLLLLTISAGILGTENANENFAPIFFWVYFLVGGSIASVLIGNVWQVINPWQRLAQLLQLNPHANFRTPEWIAPALFLSLVWFELVSDAPFSPRNISIVLLVYSWFAVILARVYSDWFTRGELFSVLFGLLGKLAFIHINDDRRAFVLTNPFREAAQSRATAGTIVFASILLAGASFDSLKESEIWYGWLFSLGFNSSTLAVGNTLGLLLAPLPFILLYILAAWLIKQLITTPQHLHAIALKFVWSLIPIAFGYMLAHNFTLFVQTAPQMLALLSDPFGAGWNLFGTVALHEVNFILGARLIWLTEIGLIVAAHIAGVWLAHLLALHAFASSGDATKSQYPMVVLMIAYTIATLWLLSQPLIAQ